MCVRSPQCVGRSLGVKEQGKGTGQWEGAGHHHFHNKFRGQNSEFVPGFPDNYEGIFVRVIG